MRLGIISDCIHVNTAEGIAASEVHIFVRQMEALSKHFDEVYICCPFKRYDGTTPVTPYTNSAIHFVPLPEVGGNNLAAKFKLLSTIPTWWKAFKTVDKLTDIVYQRFPNNLNIPGFLYFWLKKKKVFATYTGTWGKNAEPISYTFQKWLLKKYFRGPVWVYADLEQPVGNIYGGFSPSYSMTEWNEETAQVRQRISNIQQNGIQTLKMVSVGTFIDYKNQQYILDTCLLLHQKNIPFHLYLVGGGPLMEQYRNFINTHQLTDCITLTGKMTYGELRKLYRACDFVVQSPLSEGFGKVPIEGFFHGTVPIINNLTMAQYITGNGKRGILFDVADQHALFNALSKLHQDQSALPEMIEAGRHFAKGLTLEAWAEGYYKTITTYFA
jgi:glycosyltransferase involved in cell wall biosynthesis